MATLDPLTLEDATLLSQLRIRQWYDHFHGEVQQF